MFSLFPEIMFLTPVAIALLRIVAGFYLIYVGYSLYRESAAVAKEHFPLVGRMPEWVFVFASIVQITLGFLLVVGAWTQLVALLASIVALKCFAFGKVYKQIIPLERPTSLLLLVVLLVLVVTGAGAFAFDLPL